MANAERVFTNLYRDSVSLMQLSAALSARPGVEQASAVMATPANLALLAEAGLLAADHPPSPNDLLVAVAGDEAALADALEEAEGMLTRAPSARAAGRGGPPPPRSIAMALAEAPDANLALVSTPGEYAAAEAWKALRLGLHVMMFSDNVPVDDEVALKTYAREHGLLLMGPDCGTAIVNGVPLGFANSVRGGNVGVIGASGTGLQQVTCLVDRYGAGVSQAVGTGGRDLGERVGGITMLQGIAALARDPDTHVLVLVSKPPAPAVAERVLAAAEAAGKPVIACFLGAPPAGNGGGAVRAAPTLDEAARLAVETALGRPVAPEEDRDPVADEAGAGYLRGLYSGGTFCYEALVLLAGSIGPVRSTTPLDPDHRLDDPWRSQGHTVIDLGDDLFTRGRPHPMIDQTLRNERIEAEAADPEVGVILLDVVLGHGAHPDPAGEVAGAVRAARQAAAKTGREVRFVGFVCGTEADPQGLAGQEAALRDAGVLLAPSNAAAVRLAARLAGRPTAGGAAR